MSTLAQPQWGLGPNAQATTEVIKLDLSGLISDPPVEPQTEEHRADAPTLSPVLDVLRREQVYRRALACADATGFLVAALAAVALAHREPTWLMVFIAPFAVAMAKIQGLYDRDDQVIRKTSIGEWRTTLQASTMVSIGTYLAWREITNAQAGGGMRLFLFLLTASFVTTTITRACARRIARAASPPERCLIVGDPARASGLPARLMSTPGVELVGMVSEDSLTGSVAELSVVVQDLEVHRLVVSPSTDRTQNRTLHLIQAAKFIGVRVSLQPSVLIAVGGYAAFEELDGMTLLGVPRFGLSASSAALKRLFDLVLGSVALVLALPLMIVIALAIRLDSKGPALFRQVRIGRGGRPFKILKFRSMVDGADALKQGLLDQNEATGGLFKIAQDPRVTRVGRLVRSTHLDELPQLLNVLRGEMSLVGPRPLIVEEDSLLTGRDRHRLNLTPGMTGPWQVKGPLHTPISEMAMLDYRYASDWSIWVDLDILIATLFRIVGRGGH